eukprot:FN601450.1.p2 GENE.FN601450.1~~FN601450.1.p2  ORF type:complete len:53 (+),score=1.16 FN601450.1:52-210(+)
MSLLVVAMRRLYPPGRVSKVFVYRTVLLAKCSVQFFRSVAFRTPRNLLVRHP